MTDPGLSGRPELRAQLSAALNSGKLSHAVMLTGPSGSGKTSWGRLLAQAVLCPERKGIDPCLLCASCLAFASGNHAGFFYLEPEKKKLKTEQFRAVRQLFYLGDNKKACLIDQAEAMTAETSSSLLKILEEPPANLTFILLAEQPRAVFDTILSRCQRYVLQPLAYEEVYDLLLKSGKAEDEKAELLSRLSGGLPGFAFKLAEDPGFDERFKEAKALAYNVATGHNSAAQLLTWAASLAEREDLIALLELVALFYRDGLMHSLCLRGDRYNGFEKPFVWTDRITALSLEGAILLINEAIYEVTATNVNRRLTVEKLLLLLQRRLSHDHSCRN